MKNSEIALFMAESWRLPILILLYSLMSFYYINQFLSIELKKQLQRRRRFGTYFL